MATEHDLNRKERILNAAELCFADLGFDAASLRHIVAAAGENLATVYYHFRSKEGLVIAVVKRRFDPLREQNLKLLNEALAAASPRAASVDMILRAMLEPILQLARTGSQENKIVLGLIGRMWTEPSEAIQELLQREFAEVREKFYQAFRAACPHLEAPDLLWRIESARASICALLCNMRKIHDATGGVCDLSDPSTALAYLVPFFAAGFGAPSTRPSSPGRSRKKTD